MKQSTKEAGKNLVRFVLVNAAHKGPPLLFKHRKRLLKHGSKALKFSPYLLVASRVLIKYLEKKKVL